MERAEFHAREGFYFRREDDGAVRLRHVNGGTAHLTASEWASVVASVSARGETAESHAVAYAAHQEKPGC